MVLVACVFKKITTNVPEDKYLLVSNDLEIEGNSSLESGISGVIRQQPNIKFAGLMRVRLRVYNAIDSTKAAEKQEKRVNKYYSKNFKKAQKDNKINARRIAKANEKFPKTLKKANKTNQHRRKKAVKINRRRLRRVERYNKRLARKQEKYKDKKGHSRLKMKKPKKFVPFLPALEDTIPMIRTKTHYLFNYKDTNNIRPTWRMRLKYKFGESPVIADSALMEKSKQQIKAYLRSKGYYEPQIEAHFTRFKKDSVKELKPQRIIGKYTVKTGERFYIDSVKLNCPNESVAARYMRFIDRISDANGLNNYFKAALKDKKPVNFPFDASQLDAYRMEVATYMADYQFYGFTEQNVFYKVDTIRSHNDGDHRMKLTIGFSNRFVEREDKSVVEVPFKETYIKGVFFEISDTTYFPNYSDTLRKYRIDISRSKYLPTFDEDYYDDLMAKVENKDDGIPKKTYLKSKVDKNIFGNYKDSIAVNPLRLATFKYNGEMFVSEALIESQNYLENGNPYKAYYVDRSYTRMQQLGIFSQVDWELVETHPGSGLLEVHYKLVPATRQTFSFLPKATTVNGFLGVSASFNYSNINLLRTGTKMNFTIGTGFEQNSTIIQDASNDKFFNTIEIGPSLKFDIPGLFPAPVTVVGKRQRPRTELGVAVNYQQRQDFTRSYVQFDWMYKFAAGDGKTQNFGLGILAPTIKVVSISKKPEFTERINQLNDLFLKNAYNNQLIWEDIKGTFSYDNLTKDKDKKKSDRLRITFNANSSIAGYLVAPLLTSGNPQYDADGKRLMAGIPYSQFWLFDTKLITNIRYTKSRSLAFRLMYGGGHPGKNSKTSLPYDYSFSSGGANDVRGWNARQLGPGSYLSLLDPNAVATQIGDIRLEGSIEYRFGDGLFKHAFFADGGNTWTVKYDALRPGSQISNHFYEQIAFNVGYGLRLDFDFFIFRIDMGLPIFNPTLPDESRWIFEKHTTYNNLATQIYGIDYKDKLDKFQLNPFRPHFHFGIGLPF